MRHIGFCVKIVTVVIALTVAMGNVNANTGMQQEVAGLNQRDSIEDISLQGRYAVSAAIGRDSIPFTSRRQARGTRPSITNSPSPLASPPAVSQSTWPNITSGLLSAGAGTAKT